MKPVKQWNSSHSKHDHRHKRQQFTYHCTLKHIIILLRRREVYFLSCSYIPFVYFKKHLSGDSQPTVVLGGSSWLPLRSRFFCLELDSFGRPKKMIPLLIPNIQDTQSLGLHPLMKKVNVFFLTIYAAHKVIIKLKNWRQFFMRLSWISS